MAGKHDISFITPELLQLQAAHEACYEQLCRGEQPPFVPAFESDLHVMPMVAPYDGEAWLAEQLAHFKANYESYLDEITYRPFVLSLGRFDLHFASAVMGCPVFEGEEGKVWWTPLSKLGRSMAEFRAPELDDNALFQEMLGLLRFVAQATEGRIPIEIPYVSEPLIAAVDIFGEEFLQTLARDPDAADRILDAIMATILEMRRRFLATAPEARLWAHGHNQRMVPPGYTVLYGCTTQLISAKNYETHILPRDRELLKCQAHGGAIHLCGRHTQHCPAWQRMPEVKALQLNDAACDDLESYYSHLRPDQYIIFVPSEDVTLEDALKITGGRQLALNAMVDKRVPVQW
jgi:hypothetical protein